LADALGLPGRRNENPRRLVASRSQSFEFVFQPELFFLQSRHAQLIPPAMRHFGFYKFLQFLMFICDFPDV